MAIYTVLPGDTVDAIAAAYGIPADDLIYDNQIVYPYALAVGQSLFIPDGTAPSGKPSIQANGYAYTYISNWVLTQTLPYLTELSVFSYGFTLQGDLVYPPNDDSWMIAAAWQADVRPILTLTPLDASGQFNNNLISSVVRNASYKENLIGQLASILRAKGYAGVDVDFEYILADDRELFTAFVRDLADALHPYGFTVSVALAPKTSAGQPGLLYEGKDYAALGAAADYVLLMTYEWGYKYGPNMAVAPLNMVRRVVDYAVTEIPPEKIHLGIPNYGYDWPLPFERGKTIAQQVFDTLSAHFRLQSRQIGAFHLSHNLNALVVKIFVKPRKLQPGAVGIVI